MFSAPTAAVSWSGNRARMPLGGRGAARPHFTGGSTSSAQAAVLLKPWPFGTLALARMVMFTTPIPPASRTVPPGNLTRLTLNSLPWTPATLLGMAFDSHHAARLAPNGATIVGESLNPVPAACRSRWSE